MLSPDKLCGQHLTKKRNLKINIIDGDIVCFEADKETLEFIGELFIAQANFKKDCGFQLSPKGAGAIIFSSKAKMGLYIHKLEKDGGCFEKTSGVRKVS